MDWLEAILQAPIPTLLIVAGLVFITIAIAGKLGNWIELNQGWQRLVAGVLGGILLFTGIHLGMNPSGEVTIQPFPSPSTPFPSPTSSYTPTPTLTLSPSTPFPFPTSSPTPTPIPTPTLTPSLSLPPLPTISQEEARNLIERWLAAKREIYGTSYDRALGAELLTGRAYECNIRRPDGSESSVDWLQNNGAYWTYGVQRIDSVKSFFASGDRATIEVLITEERTLYNRQDEIDRNASKFDQSRMRYDLQLDGGQWKIAYYYLPNCPR